MNGVPLFTLSFRIRERDDDRCYRESSAYSGMAHHLRWERPGCIDRSAGINSTEKSDIL
jgi:hypothetical protein